MKKRILLLIIIFALEIVTFQKWFLCWLFQDNFYFTIDKVISYVVEATNFDAGVPLVIVRLLHNKLVVFPWGVSQALLQYWDIRFLNVFVSIVGGVGVYLGLWYFFTKFRKNILLWILLIVSLSISLIEIVHRLPIDFGFRIIPLFVIFQIFSLFGIWQFLKPSAKFRYVVIILLIIVSFLSFFVAPLSYENFCLHI